MEELDGDDVRVSSRGRYAERDIVQVALGVVKAERDKASSEPPPSLLPSHCLSPLTPSAATERVPFFKNKDKNRVRQKNVRSHRLAWDS